jgi:GNAT superfamily N-acetyltransferase
MRAEIRKATVRDAAAIADLNEEFNGLRMPLAMIRMRLCANRKEVVLIAVIARRPVGYACIQYSRSFCHPHPWAEVTEMYVRSGHRRRGIGMALVQAAEAESRKRGVDQIIVLTGEKNTRGQRLYNSAGYRATRKYVYKKTLANNRLNRTVAPRRRGSKSG